MINPKHPTHSPSTHDPHTNPGTTQSHPTIHAPTPEAQTLLTTYGHTAQKSLEQDLQRHPYLKQRPTFPKAYTHNLWHRILTAARTDNQLTNTTYKALATITGIHAGRIRDWHLSEKEPHLERTLRIHETARQHWEHTLSQEAKLHTLDPSLVYNTLQPILNHPEHHTPQAIATAIKTLYHHGKNQRLTIVELKPYHKTGPQHLRTVAHTITKHRPELENTLTQSLNLSNQELRIAVDHDVLYLWRKTTHSDHWLNIYKHELLYLSPYIKQQLITTAQRHLNVNKQQLGQLLTQLTDHKGQRTFNTRATPYELTHHSPSLHGDTLHLLINTTNQPSSKIKSYITQIGRISNLEQKGGIKNPRFPENDQLEELRARLIAIALSDCHINKNTHVLTYHEKDHDRINYVRTLFRQLGDTDYKTEELQGQRKRLTITAVIGRLLEHWGVPKGDKHLHPNFRLPKRIREGAYLAKCAYLQEVIPEEGYFTKRAHFRFGIKRAQVLASGDKGKTYGFDQKVTPEEKAFIQKYGRERIYQIRDDRPRQEFILVWGKLRRLAEEAANPEEKQIAECLMKTIQQNKCKLLEDEIQLASSLGIRMYKLIKQIHFHEGKRVSAIWEAYTRTREDTYKWANIALPSTGTKRKAAEEWVTQYQLRFQNDSKNISNEII